MSVPGKFAVQPADRGRVRVLLAAAVSLVMWYLPGIEYLVYPFRLFVTIVHEGCHALMAVLTGGVVQDMVIKPDASGYTISGGGDLPLITMAGYIGTALCGALILQTVRRKGGGGVACTIMGAAALVVTLLWVRNVFGVAAGMIVGLSILGCARIPALPVRDFVGSFLCVQLCLNAFFDIRELILITTQTNIPNDAVYMSERAGLSPVFWACFWLVSAAVILGVALRAFWSRVR